MIKVSKLIIKKFRSFLPESEFEIGQGITFIAGINGTAKSTLLGMICQPLGFPDRQKANSAYTHAYDDVDLLSFSTLSGMPFKADFSDVFRISQKFDKARGHEYILKIDGDSLVPDSLAALQGLVVRSEKRNDQPDNELRFVTNSFSRNAGEGNFPHPVIYLGLDRLRPLSTLKKKDIIVDESLPEDEKKIWEDIYRSVMISNAREIILPEHLDTGKGFKKSYHSVQTSFFDGESASAGQDNLGQIITALISFYRLKQSLREKYQGGILLIDEFDATLHPIAQRMLLEKLITYSQNLNLQVIATTHSLTILEDSCHRFRSHVSLLYLEKKSNKIVLHNNADYDFIASDLAHICKKAKLGNPKATILFEDSVAADFFKQATGNIFNSYLHIYNAEDNNNDTALPNDVLKSIAARLSSKKIPDFEKIIFVLDPDSRNLLKPALKNLLALPGNFFIEKEVYNLLLNLDDGDPCWNQIFITTQPRCFAGFNNIANDPNLRSDKDRKIKYKTWYNQQKISGVWGRCSSKLFKFWSSRNISQCHTFCLQVLDALVFIRHPLIISQKEDLRKKIEKKFPLGK